VPAAPTSRSPSHHARRPGSSFQATSSTPDSAGPLRRRPSTRVPATETSGASGQRRDIVTQSRTLQEIAAEDASRMTAGDRSLIDSGGFATAAAGELASSTSARSAIQARASASSPVTSPGPIQRAGGRRPVRAGAMRVLGGDPTKSSIDATPESRAEARRAICVGPGPACTTAAETRLDPSSTLSTIRRRLRSRMGGSTCEGTPRAAFELCSAGGRHA